MRNIYKKGTIFSIAALLAILAVSPASAAETWNWRKDKPCGRQLPGLQAVKLEGCARAFCSDLPVGARLCACLKPGEAGEMTITLESKDQAQKQLTVEVSPSGLDTASFRLDAADLDADGREELLFGVMDSQGQGMGIQHWKVWAIAGNEFSNGITVSDYGVMSFPACPEGRKGALLLGSRWISGWEPSRGEGLYIAARWYRFDEGSLYPAPGRPAIYHRYTSSLAEERGQQLGTDRPSPLRWHAKKNARMLTGPYPFE